MSKLEIDFKMWNKLGGIELENSQDQVKVGKTNSFLQHICQFCSGFCIHSLSDVRKTLSLSPKYIGIGKTDTIKM